MKILVITLSLFLSISVFAAKIEVEIKGMTCGMCVSSITKELQKTEKTQEIKVSLEEKKATFIEIKGKKISDNDIKAAIKNAGYEATKITRLK